MSSHGCGVALLPLGSVADKVVRSAGAPVLIQRPRRETAQPAACHAKADVAD